MYINSNILSKREKKRSVNKKRKSERKIKDEKTGEQVTYLSKSVFS